LHWVEAHGQSVALLDTSVHGGGGRLEAIELERILIGRDGTRTWIDVTGPISVSQGTAPTPVDLGTGDWQTFVVGEAGFGGSADAAIRGGYDAGRRIG
jgi:hypothetical protein